MTQTYNFSAGPATLPKAVLEQAQAELISWYRGMSVMEISHRSPVFIELVLATEQLLRELLRIPEHYRVFFLQGGASQQFAMVPLNLLGHNQSADYIVTGYWSAQAASEAQRYGKINIAASSHAQNYAAIPAFTEWQLQSQAAYIHYTTNETIHGVEFNDIPPVSEVPLVADMSSNLLSWPIDVSRYGIIYASAQKNLGPAGLTLVIIREDLMGHAQSKTPAFLNYQNHANAAPPCLNTAPTFIWYMINLVLNWIKAQGGVMAMATHNQQKAALLYEVIDQSGFYQNHIAKNCRSRMNVPFHLAIPSLTSEFLAQANAAGLMNLAGHRAVGGIRASLYNAMSLAGVEALAAFMQTFERQYG